MAKENLVILSRFEKQGDIAPVEVLSLCVAKHYEAEKQKRDLSQFQETRVTSSMPETWCNGCHPEFDNPKYWGY